MKRSVVIGVACCIGACLSFTLSSGVMANERAPGSAEVAVADLTYLLPIECRKSAAPWMGFATEPSRITKERTGRSNPVRLNVRPWKDTQYTLISLDRYIAWVQIAPGAVGQQWSIQLDMSPVSFNQGGMPVMMTFDRWQEGNRPEGIANVHIVANCSQRDPAAPSTAKR